MGDGIIVIDKNNSIFSCIYQINVLFLRYRNRDKLTIKTNELWQRKFS